MSTTDLQDCLNRHGLWVVSLGRSGSRLVAEDIDFTGMALAGINLMDAELPGADFSGTCLRDADLSGGNFGSARFADCDLSAAWLVKTNLDHARLDRARLVGTKLCRASLIEASLHDARLDQADLSGADLEGADFGHASVIGCDMSRVFFKNTACPEPVCRAWLVCRKPG
jgi:uncharacterized protein YjbI with pentapeptide repeats